MKAIKQELNFLFTVAGLIIAAASLILINYSISPNAFIKVIFTFTLLINMLFIGILIWQYKRLKMVELIMENEILYIRSAIISSLNSSDKDWILPAGKIEAIISCFGIILDGKIIKFNLAGIHLKSVEIGHDFISLTYGTEKMTQRTRILHQTIDSSEQKRIVERFRYETGVVPVMTD